MADGNEEPQEGRGQNLIEYGILLAIGTQIRTVMTETPAQQIGEP